MRNNTYLLSLVVGGIVAAAGGNAAAETHRITPASGFKWSYMGQSSKNLIVGDLKIGDIVDIQIPAAAIPHGFSAVKKEGAVISPVEDLVWKCGETETDKPGAVLKEVECGGTSRYGIPFSGSMKLEVLPSFKDDVPFWCVIHQAGMQGVLKLQPASSSTPEMKK